MTIFESIGFWYIVFVASLGTAGIAYCAAIGFQIVRFRLDVGRKFEETERGVRQEVRRAQ